MATPTIPFATAGFVTGGTFNYYALCSDGDDIVSRPGLLAIAAGKQLRGAILKIDPATSNVTVPAAATDCNCILAIDCDATSAIAPCQVYVGGKFKADAVIWPGALSHALITENLRDVDIQLESVVFTDGSLVKTLPTEAQVASAKQVIAENKARVEKAKEEAKPDDPGRDSPWAYLTPEEQANHPELATIHDRENEEEAEAEKESEKEGGKGDRQQKPPAPQPHHSHQPPPPPKPNKGNGD